MIVLFCQVLTEFGNKQTKKQQPETNKGEPKMTTDLKMLLATTILAAFHYLPYAVAFIRHWGLSYAASNRADLKPLPDWAMRAQAAHCNMTENFSHFAVLVLLVHALGANNQLTAVGTMLFFYGRLVYLFVYTLGLPWIRSLAYFVGVVGEILMIVQLVKFI